MAIRFSPIGQSIFRPIARLVAGEVFLAMGLSSLIDFSDEEKLETLQRLDVFWVWHSLDEKRHCLICGKTIAGREIKVTGGPREMGPVRVSCPTEHCKSIPMDWVRLTDDVLIKISKLGAESSGVAAPEVHPPTRQNSIL